MKDDTISRAAAIEICRKAKDKGQAHRMLTQLPSAQPVAKDINVPVKDCISRQAALDIYDDYNVAVENGELESYRKYRKQMLALPSAQQWIPCKERLPEKDGEYLTTTEDGLCDVEYYGDGEWYYDNVVAWMPLPAAYQKGEKE